MIYIISYILLLLNQYWYFCAKIFFNKKAPTRTKPSPVRVLLIDSPPPNNGFVFRQNKEGSELLCSLILCRRRKHGCGAVNNQGWRKMHFIIINNYGIISYHII